MMKSKDVKAIIACRMYFFQKMTTERIAKELQVSRSTVSRLICYARESGLLEIRLNDEGNQHLFYERSIQNFYQINEVHVVPVSDLLGETEWLEQVGQYSAHYLNTVFDSNMIMGVAWGTTLTYVSKYLLRKNTHDSHIVQLNGAGNTRSMGIEYASQIVQRFADNYEAKAHLFPVPTFFDYSGTKKLLWQERSIRTILEIQNKANLLLFSIGAVNGGVPSHVYSGGYLEEKDYKELCKHNVIGDIATVFFQRDGSHLNIPMNLRSSGPDLEMFKEKKSICVVSGLAKVAGLDAALRGGFIKVLIVDEPTARSLIENFTNYKRQ
ncbi:MAG: sugar-binding domain-containing protein [Anaerolineaceae bacterium]|nr:sugar-binding domain-containing protein [Anaerolineaceae bacterium]